MEHYQVVPDGITLAKGIGGGIPLGVFSMTAELAKQFPKNIHSSTFGGNPVSMAAGVATINYAKTHKLWQQVQQKGTYFLESLQPLMKSQSVKQIRGLGLVIAIELHQPSEPFIQQLQQHYRILTFPRPNIIMLIPPLTIPYSEIDVVIAALTELFDDNK